MEHLVAAFAGGAVALWFSRAGARRASQADGARALGPVEFLLVEAREAARPPVATRRRTDRAVARLDAMVRTLDARGRAADGGRG